MNTEYDTAIIIVNWNGEHLLERCLSSLRKQTYQKFEIILVDNGSKDNSVGYVRENFPEVKIIALAHNTGFAHGNNAGISMGLQNKKIQNVILLNNDTKVKSDFLEKLVGAIDDKLFINKKIGALAPKMLLGSGSGNSLDDFPEAKPQRDKPQRKGGDVIDAVGAKVDLDGRGYSIGHGEIDRGQYDKKQEVFGFCGGAVLLRREMLEDVVGDGDNFVEKTPSTSLQKRGEYKEYFDDNFFAYYEDADLSWRMRLRGWQVFTAPKAVAWHLHSATADTIKSKTFKAYYLNRNRFFMMLKNFPCKLLWSGLRLVPRSYFKRKNDKIKIVSNTKEDKKNGNRIIEDNGAKRKIIMVWVMTKVGWNLFFNGWRLWQERKVIQYNRRVKLENLEKWLENNP